MKHILITGVPGSGKTTIASLLENQGFNVVDGLVNMGLAYWMNKTTFEDDTQKKRTGIDWFQNHTWKWKESKLIEFLQKNDKGKSIFISGVVPMEKTLLRYFDKIFLISLPHELIIRRLKERPGSTVFGKGVGEIDYVLSWHEDFEKFLLENNAVKIDGQLTPQQILETILRELRFLSS